MASVINGSVVVMSQPRAPFLWTVACTSMTRRSSTEASSHSSTETASDPLLPGCNASGGHRGH